MKTEKERELSILVYHIDDPLSMLEVSGAGGMGVTGADPLSEAHSHHREDLYVFLHEIY